MCVSTAKRRQVASQQAGQRTAPPAMQPLPPRKVGQCRRTNLIVGCNGARQVAHRLAAVEFGSVKKKLVLLLASERCITQAAIVRACVRQRRSSECGTHTQQVDTLRRETGFAAWKRTARANGTQRRAKRNTQAPRRRGKRAQLSSSCLSHATTATSVCFDNNCKWATRKTPQRRSNAAAGKKERFHFSIGTLLFFALLASFLSPACVCSIMNLRVKCVCVCACRQAAK